MALPHNLHSDAQSLPLFSGLKCEQLAEIEKHLHVRVLPSGTMLLSVDHLSASIYMILSGGLKLKSLRHDGRETMIALLGPGEVLGDSITDDFVNDGFVVEATETSTLLWMRRDLFHDFLRIVPTLSYNFSQHLARRLSSMTRYLELSTLLDVNGRVAYRLLSYARLYGQAEADTAEVTIPMRITQTDLAQLIGASRVSVNQSLGTFKRLGYIRVDQNRMLVIRDFDALGRFCRV